MNPRETRGPRLALGAVFAALFGAASLTALAVAAPAPVEDAPPKWIWIEGESKDDQVARFRREFTVPDGAVSAKLVATCDNRVKLLLDGKPILENTDWNEPTAKDVTPLLLGAGKTPRKHVLAARCKNEGGAAALLVRLTFENKDGKTTSVITDASWRSSKEATEPAGWAEAGFSDEKWPRSKVVASLGDGPWTSVNLAALDSAARHGGPVAPDPDKFKVAKGFKVERLYTVPKDEQGSWVSMTVDPKGRLIVSDQYGKLYRVTPPPLGSTDTPKVEPIPVEIGEAQGLTWYKDALYVVVNRGEKFASGLYRVIDKDKDDTLDTVEKLRVLDGGGEHGPHAVVPSPDGKSLYVIAGNATRLTELAGSLVPRIYDEDQILPYLPDGRGFMTDERAPGGCVYRVDPDGKSWELVSMGYRNPYDIAFNRHGDLFTYDSDMEWDVNLPWYRPTRVCQVDSGSDLGYRNGSGKWPTYYPDSLPPVVNIGPGSPTGITFGYGAKFPAKYQDALFISDWSYGKLYAVHLTAKGSTYAPEVEEFITGQPLPLTDLVVNPVDQSLYFTIGGRRTLSGLYRVTYTGTESTAPAPVETKDEAARALRRSLEAFHGKKDPAAIDFAWPHLDSPDRFIRFAARVAIEHQDVKLWQDKALAETRPNASLTALLALTRAGDKGLQEAIIDSLGRLEWDRLSTPQKLDALRVLEVAIARMGTPADNLKGEILARVEPLFPAKGRELNSELSKILVALQSPSIAARLVPLLSQAPTQEEQVDYAIALRRLKSGWTPELRKAYFQWFRVAANYKGGASLSGFIKEIREEAIGNLSEAEKTALKPILDAPAETKAPVATAPSRPFVKAWTVDELAPIVESGLTGRDFDRGRSLFAATSCFSCHRYDNEGGSVGPDLTGVSGRFSPRDLLESIILPSKSVSDQYQAISVATTDGRVVTGRVVNLNGDTMMISVDMLDPNNQVSLSRKQIEEIKPSPVSMMPEGLLNTLKADEILDMLAYLLSRGDRSSPMFR